MTKTRVHGSDHEFSEWMRHHPSLPSYSGNIGFVATDVDLHIHRYLTSVDGLGTRDIQSMMTIEVKTRGGQCESSQLDTLAKQHVCSQGQQFFMGQLIWHWGVSFVRMSDETPDLSTWIKWGRFVGPKRVKETLVSVNQLLDLMLFELNPDTLLPKPFRRHHKTHKYFVEETSPLGFKVEKPIVKRS